MHLNLFSKKVLTPVPVPVDFYKVGTSFIEGGWGQREFFSLLQNACELAMLLPRLSSKTLTGLQNSSEMIRAGDRATVFTKLPNTIQRVRVAYKNWRHASGNVTRQRELLLHDSADLVGNGPRLLQFFSLVKVVRIGKICLERLGLLGCGTGLIIDGIELKHDIEDLRESLAKGKGLSEQERTIEKGVRKALLIDIARLIASLACTIFALGAFFLGFALVGPLVLLALGTFSSFGVLWAHLAQKTALGERLAQAKIAAVI